MDTATAGSEGRPEESAAGRSPSIGVPSIPAQDRPSRTPVPVPSVPVPSGPEPTGPEPTGPEAAAPAGHSGSSPSLNRSPGAGESSAQVQPVGGAPFESAFPPRVAGTLGWYVYLLAEPGSRRPFFVGRGRGDRCFDHVRAARTVQPSTAGTISRAEKKFRALDRIRQIEAADGPVQVEIVRYGLSADEARLAAEVAADALGLPPEGKRQSQRQPAGELGIRLAKQAKFKRGHPVVLLQVGAAVGAIRADGVDGDDGTNRPDAADGADRADLAYGIVRHGWRIGRRWTDPNAPRSPRWAVIVAGELVVGVYRIDRWEPTPLVGRQDRPDRPGRPGAPTEPGSGSTTRSTYRHSFIGERDQQLEDRYLGRSVAEYLQARPGAQSRTGSGVALPFGPPKQVAYVGCGPNAAVGAV